MFPVWMASTITVTPSPSRGSTGHCRSCSTRLMIPIFSDTRLAEVCAYRNDVESEVGHPNVCYRRGDTNGLCNKTRGCLLPQPQGPSPAMVVMTIPEIGYLTAHSGPPVLSSTRFQRRSQNPSSCHLSPQRRCKLQAWYSAHP